MASSGREIMFLLSLISILRLAAACTILLVYELEGCMSGLSLEPLQNAGELI
jgi:hypothetical protein